jgi:hypothetical protein
VANADQLQQPATFATVQQKNVISRQHRDLGGRKQLQHGDPAEPRNATSGATDGPGDKSTSHLDRV